MRKTANYKRAFKIGQYWASRHGKRADLRNLSHASDDESLTFDGNDDCVVEHFAMYAARMESVGKWSKGYEAYESAVRRLCGEKYNADGDVVSCKPPATSTWQGFIDGVVETLNAKFGKRLAAA